MQFQVTKKVLGMRGSHARSVRALVVYQWKTPSSRFEDREQTTDFHVDMICLNLTIEMVLVTC